MLGTSHACSYLKWIYHTNLGLPGCYLCIPFRNKMPQKHSSNTSLKTHHACKAHTIPSCNFVSQTWMKTSAIASGVGAPKHRFLTPLRTPLAKSFHHWLELVSQHHSHATGRPSCSGWHGNQAGKKKTSRFTLMFWFWHKGLAI